MDGTSATTGDMKPVSLETLTRAMQEIDLLPKPDQWIVIDPQGRMYKGKVEEVIRVLLAEHFPRGNELVQRTRPSSM